MLSKTIQTPEKSNIKANVLASQLNSFCLEMPLQEAIKRYYRFRRRKSDLRMVLKINSIDFHCLGVSLDRLLSNKNLQLVDKLSIAPHNRGHAQNAVLCSVEAPGLCINYK